MSLNRGEYEKYRRYKNHNLRRNRNSGHPCVSNENFLVLGWGSNANVVPKVECPTCKRKWVRGSICCGKVLMTEEEKDDSKD